MPPPSPLIYEIHTRSWLAELSEACGKSIHLQEVPDEFFLEWRRLGFTHLWLMGIWKIGPKARAKALCHWRKHWHHEPENVSLGPKAIIGSPYAISGFEVAEELGGIPALQRFRARLHSHGLKLILDFIPNHTGLDHPWLAERPDLYVSSARKLNGTFLNSAGGRTRSGSRSAGRTSEQEQAQQNLQSLKSSILNPKSEMWVAHGKDPYFPPWNDTGQLDYRNQRVHAIMISELRKIASCCDGVRCDMAMLLLPEIFHRTWSRFPVGGPVATAEFWPAAIRATKTAFPRFEFLAEVYWGLEDKLLGLGFDYVYDKTFYDCVMARDQEKFRDYLKALLPANAARRIWFLENHDEPRAASRLSMAEHEAAAKILFSLPGMKLLHHGQLEGTRQFHRIQFRQRPREKPDAAVRALYERLMVRE